MVSKYVLYKLMVHLTGFTSTAKPCHQQSSQGREVYDGMGSWEEKILRILWTDFLFPPEMLLCNIGKMSVKAPFCLH